MARIKGNVSHRFGETSTRQVVQKEMKSSCVRPVNRPLSYGPME